MSNWPCFSQEEEEAVLAVLRSGKVNYWTGNEGQLFEKEFANYIGVDHAVAVSNGTVALELCLRALEIGPGDEVIVTSRTFLASATAIIACGATPVFADVSLDSQNITVETIDAVCSKKTKGIITVHLAGWPCQMAEITKYAKGRGICVIEDCAQAHGASINGKKVGSWGDMAAFSFCQDKIMTTGGEGGMVTTNSKVLWERAWSYKDHGKSYNTVFNRDHPPGFRWLHESFGSNYRMTEMQAAVGRIQLKKLEAWIRHRKKNAAILYENLSILPYFHLSIPPSDYNHAYYKYYAFLKPTGFVTAVDRQSIIYMFNKCSVSCNAGSCSEIYLEQCFEGHPSFPYKRLGNAKRLGEMAIMFLCDPTIDSAELDNNLKQAAEELNNLAQ